MLLFPLLLCGALTISSASAGQVPVVDGVLGGVPSSASVSHETTRKLFTIAATTPGQLRIKENTGICGKSRFRVGFLPSSAEVYDAQLFIETTSGVYQASGYGDITATKSIWFWFFAARKNPSTAPVALWFNGGVRCPSSI